MNGAGTEPQRQAVSANMVLGFRHTLRGWPRGLALVLSVMFQASFASFRVVS